MTTDGPRRVTLGGRKLAEYLRRTGRGVMEFARSARVDRAMVYRVLNGDRWRAIPIAFCMAVRGETRGEIQLEDFHPDTALPSGSSSGGGSRKGGAQRRPTAKARRAKAATSSSWGRSVERSEKRARAYG